MVLQLLRPDVNEVSMMQVNLIWISVGAWSGRPRTAAAVLEKVTEMMLLQQRLLEGLDFSCPPQDLQSWLCKEEFVSGLVACITTSNYEQLG